MRIRTVLGPPLPHEIVRDTAAIVLSINEEPASPQLDPCRADVEAGHTLDPPQCGQDAQGR